MPDLSPESDQNKKALIFGDDQIRDSKSVAPKAEDGVHIKLDDSAKIVSSSGKRWKLFGVIGVAVISLVLIGVLINGGSTDSGPKTETFTGSGFGPGGFPSGPGPGPDGIGINCTDGQVLKELSPGIVICVDPEEDEGSAKPVEDPPDEDPPEAGECTGSQKWDFIKEACVDSQVCKNNEKWDPATESCVKPKTGGSGPSGSNGACPKGMKEKKIKLPGQPVITNCVPEETEKPKEKECSEGFEWKLVAPGIYGCGEKEKEAPKTKSIEEICAEKGQIPETIQVGYSTTKVCVDPPKKLVTEKTCAAEGKILQPQKGGDICVDPPKKDPLKDRPKGTSQECKDLEKHITEYSNIIKSLKNTSDDSAFEKEILEFLLSKNVKYALDIKKCTNLSNEYNSALKCKGKEMFNPANNTCKVHPGYKKFAGKFIADCKSVDKTLKAIDKVTSGRQISKQENFVLTELKKDLKAAKEFSCKAEASKKCDRGFTYNEKTKKCVKTALNCRNGLIPNIHLGKCVAPSTKTKCAEGLVEDRLTGDCVLPATPKTAACKDLEPKIVKYKNLLSSKNNSNYSNMTNGEKSVIEYLLDYTLKKALSENCDIDSDYQAALECETDEMFDTKTDKCKAIAGYKDLSTGEKEVNCSNYSTVLAAIDLWSLDESTNTKEKSLLASLKLNLAQFANFCAQASSGNGLVGNSGSGSSSSSGGGGSYGGGGSFKNSKDFDVENIQVKPESFNPFKQHTKVHFFLTHISYVKMEILDGAEVIAESKEEKMNAGDRFLIWDGRKDNGGFVGEKEYEYKLLVKKATNKKNFIERKGFINVKYFDENFEIGVDPGFESFTGPTGITGPVSFENTGISSSNSIASSHGVSSPLTQAIHLEGAGKTRTSEVGPERMIYLLFLIPLYFIARKPV